MHLELVVLSPPDFCHQNKIVPASFFLWVGPPLHVQHSFSARQLRTQHRPPPGIRPSPPSPHTRSTSRNAATEPPRSNPCSIRMGGFRRGLTKMEDPPEPLPQPLPRTTTVVVSRLWARLSLEVCCWLRWSWRSFSAQARNGGGDEATTLTEKVPFRVIRGVVLVGGSSDENTSEFSEKKRKYPDLWTYLVDRHLTAADLSCVSRLTGPGTVTSRLTGRHTSRLTGPILRLTVAVSSEAGGREVSGLQQNFLQLCWLYIVHSFFREMILRTTCARCCTRSEMILRTTCARCCTRRTCQGQLHQRM